jgi:hypothetical protein
VLVDLQLGELKPLGADTEPNGLLICVTAMEKDHPDNIKRLEA